MTWMPNLQKCFTFSAWVNRVNVDGVLQNNRHLVYLIYHHIFQVQESIDLRYPVNILKTPKPQVVRCCVSECFWGKS